ncbi:ErmCL family antibiotic resistance leader peptide [Streptococcus suis]|nr:ErmCL family antibiotic resistance leader peptide [Streptococcus suis]RRR56437.1 ErmCL family antibiotic resistance leader peptide [Streptococcus suis]RRR63230.1 ErmCL family antibiotic resistance leader peptide [Streptococcus suis]HEL1557245.1 ErmCL family antibiotic resistance leader peptide [Streptococcus suis]HEL1558158.1 ErmCL family antibiotic resistance leader peptide [Streptococcus suis]
MGLYSIFVIETVHYLLSP